MAIVSAGIQNKRSKSRSVISASHRFFPLPLILGSVLSSAAINSTVLGSLPPINAIALFRCNIHGLLGDNYKSYKTQVSLCVYTRTTKPSRRKRRDRGILINRDMSRCGPNLRIVRAVDKEVGMFKGRRS